LSNVVVFDLDGVITSEQAYWDTAGLVLHELLYSPRYWNITGAEVYVPVVSAEESRQISRATFPESIIVSLKARSVNSNWDTCYTGFCAYLLALLASLPDCSALWPLQPWDGQWTARFREQLATYRGYRAIDVSVFDCLSAPELRDASGLALLDSFDAYASSLLGLPVTGVFGRYSRSWKFCADLFQEWYLGEELYTSQYQHTPGQVGKPGCIHFEQPLLPVEQLRAMLAALKRQGYTLGVATGRPGDEAILPLKNYGLYEYFDAQRIITHADVAVAEARLRAQGDSTPLVKPHPYQFLRAADPGYQPGQLLPMRGSFVVVGDTTSDVQGAHAANALIIAVLTGALTQEARTLLEQSQPDFIVEDVTHVPALLASLDDLATIQRLQFSQREQAELLLQRWFALRMQLPTECVVLTPRPVSLNSFNGFYYAAGEEYFFKTHIEDQGILEEYYHAELLHQAGYNIVRPLRTLHEKGQQMVVYPVVRWPVMFDIMRAVETGQAEDLSIDLLVAAEKRECERLLEIYAATLAESTPQEHAQAPVHQLFWHRLTGGRYRQFYEGQTMPLPTRQGIQEEADSILFAALLHYRWVINGTPVTGPYQTLAELIEQARRVLQPARPAYTIIGHGDAHFGNVFLEGGPEEQKGPRYLYFDPAFAGRHMPILDIVKPFFHNIFATWMYFPDEVARKLELSVTVRDTTVFIEHNYELTLLRRQMLQTKLEYLLRPLINLLRAKKALPDDWPEVMRLALMCCPLLTINLLDEQRIPTSVGWLGLSQVVQMGNLALIGG
jgi:phosphoglycolate phosphatase-like HAD superfamily hydrolase